MKVSVLIPYYNDREYLPLAIESVLNQTYQDFELILVNHATTDDCREIAHSYNDSRIVHLDMDKNYGAGTGLIMEKFLENATGEYVKLFCADDIMYPNCLKDLVNYLSTHPEKDFAFGNVEYIDTCGKSLHKNWYMDRKHFSVLNDEVKCLQLFFKGYGYLPYIGSIVKTEILKNISIDKSFIALFDMSLWVSILLQGYKIGYINKIVSGYRIHDNQVSSHKNVKKMGTCSAYESLKYIELFVKSSNYKLLRQVLKNNIYMKKIPNITDTDLKFITCYEMFFADIGIYHYTAYYYLYDMLQNREQRNYLEQKFHFGVKELRQLYSSNAANKVCDYDDFSIKFLLYLILKKVIKIVTFSKKRQKEQQMTL